MSGISPIRFAAHLTIYLAVLLLAIILLLQLRPDAVRYLPLGGTDALTHVDMVDLKDSLSNNAQDLRATSETDIPEWGAAANVGNIALFMFGHLTGTILIILPIAWTYRVINYGTGFNKTFVRSLVVLPICATTIVLLIQDNLALAFGLAALVAAVRFRVALDDALDGIFIFAAICVGLAGGIGYLGVAYIMCVFFCFGNLILWMVDYGRNPHDDLRQQKKRDKLSGKHHDSGSSMQ